MKGTRWVPVGERSWLFVVSDDVSESVHERVQAIVRAVDESPPPGLLEVVPAYSSVLFEFDPLLSDPSGFRKAVAMRVARAARAAVLPGQRIEIPVVYGGERGPDLEGAAKALGITPDALVSLHAQHEYRVFALGFAPGFPYLGVLPEALALPRRATPRESVPAGSVAITERQCAIFPLERPSGWHVLGWTPVRLFRPDSSVPFALLPGDRVTFRPVADEAAALDWEEEVLGRIPGRRVFAGGVRRARPEGLPLLRVRLAGHHTTVQDAGRRGFARFGMPGGGAMDEEGLATANLLCGNEPGAPALESVWEGPVVEALADCVVAIAGARTLPRVNGDVRPPLSAIRLRKGDELRVGNVVDGLHVYLAVQGGIAAESFLGSASTYVPAGVGGERGIVRAGTVVASAEQAWRDPVTTEPVPDGIGDPVEAVPLLRTTIGPHARFFTRSSLDALFRSPLRFTARSDRTGLWIDGVRLKVQKPLALTSSPFVRGAIQAPPSGDLVLIAADGNAVGGYPVVAVVCRADQSKLAQIQPGEPFRLMRVSTERAVEAAREQQDRLAATARFAHGEGLAGMLPSLRELLATPGVSVEAVSGVRRAALRRR